MEPFHIAQSMIDRLIDDEPGAPDRPWISRAEAAGRLKASVRRDLEWLLNARAAAAPPQSLRELNRSVFVYGLPDYSGYSLTSPADRARLVADIETSVRKFEPRLANVAVVALDPERLAHAMRFRIEALLMTDPAPEPVSFDTVLELNSGEYRVKGASDAG
jgi:type VI secretion system protein ImpF